MGIEARDTVWNNSQSKGAARLVLLCIAEHADENMIAWPGINRISELTQVSPRQVSRCIKQLEEINELKVLIKGDGRGYTTRYQILIKGDTMSPFSEEKRVTFDTQKDDICDIKDDMVSIKDDMVSSKPSITVKEPSGNKKSAPPFPPAYLATPDFLNVWNEWLTYHDERGSPLSTSTALKQFQQFDEWGIDKSITAIEASIKNNWIGIFEPKPHPNGSKKGDDTMDRLKARMEKAKHERE